MEWKDELPTFAANAIYIPEKNMIRNISFNL